MYSYKTRQQIYLRESMVGDTVKIEINSMWNLDKGDRIITEEILKIVID